MGSDMEKNQKQTSFTFEIDNLWEKEDVISSPIFLSGGCEWVVQVYPKGYGTVVEDHLALFLCVANPESLKLGWKRRANNSVLLLDQFGKELYRSNENCRLFCAQFTKWGESRGLPLKDKWILEKNKLIIKVDIKVVEVVDEAQVTGMEMLDLFGFQFFYSQVVSVSRLFEEHPDIKVNFKPKIQLVKNAYMTTLLGLIETLDKPPHSFTETELVSAKRELIELTEAGFKLDWLDTKLDEVFSEWKKANAKNYTLSFGTNADHEVILEEEWLIEGIIRSWNEFKVFFHLDNEKID
ncbi:unnamed protein product [Arabidopsis lyrata]|nr:unnamed protein product [Arabidopsis lyrata]